MAIKEGLRDAMLTAIEITRELRDTAVKNRDYQDALVLDGMLYVLIMIFIWRL